MHACGSDLKLYDDSYLKTDLYMRGLGPDVVSLVGLTRVYLLNFFCPGVPLYVLLSPYICVLSPFYILISMY